VQVHDGGMEGELDEENTKREEEMERGMEVVREIEWMEGVMRIEVEKKVEWVKKWRKGVDGRRR